MSQYHTIGGEYATAFGEPVVTDDGAANYPTYSGVGVTLTAAGIDPDAANWDAKSNGDLEFHVEIYRDGAVRAVHENLTAAEVSEIAPFAYGSGEYEARVVGVNNGGWYTGQQQLSDLLYVSHFRHFTRSPFTRSPLVGGGLI